MMMMMSAYYRGFWNDRGNWVFVSVVVSFLAIWSARAIVEAIWDDLNDARKKGGSKSEIAKTIGSGVLILSIPILLAVASVSKAVYENQRWQRHQANERIAAAVAVDLTDDGAVGSKSEASVLSCLLDSLDDWAVFRDGDKDTISQFLLKGRSECSASAPQQSEVDNFMQTSPPDDGSLQGGSDCDIVCVPVPSEDDYIPEPSNDPCEGFNQCIEGPDGRYGEDWINDPLDELNDGR